MKILTVGGGSGGHVTPVRAVINELCRHTNDVEVRFICDRNFSRQARAIMAGANVSVRVQTIVAGKLRRYYGVSWWRQLLDVPTTLLNIRDTILVGFGTLQSVFILLTWRPQVIFTKGGFVCLPVGIAAKICRIPLVIHDSDAHPGLTNRILAKWATYIATGAPLGNYAYPDSISSYVGIPVDPAFKPYTSEEKAVAKSSLGLVDTAKPLVLVTGGGLGAKRINDAMTRIGDQLVADGIVVYHVTGQGQYQAVTKIAPQSVDYIVVPFVSEKMYEAIGAADVVVTRAGATTLLELAAAMKPTIIIPNPMLTGGHQTKNAAVYMEAQAAIVIDEETLRIDPDSLYDAISGLVKDADLAERYGKRLGSFAKPEAALEVAELIVNAATKYSERR